MRKEIFFVVILDSIMLFLASSILFYLKFESNLFDSIICYPIQQLIINSSFLTIFWLLLFYLREMYKSFYFKNTIEILAETIFSIFIGIIIFLILISFTEASIKILRIGLFLYFFLLLGLVGSARVIFKLVQVNFLKKGYGKRNTLIIGFNNDSKRIINEYKNGSLIGFNIIGFIDNESLGKTYKKTSVLGDISDLNSIIDKYSIREIILALDKQNDIEINKIISYTKNRKISFKILPSLTNIISGQVKSCQVLGFPLMELFPELQSPLQRLIKRIFDIAISLFILLITSPAMLICAIIIRLESPGEIVFKQKRVGKDFKEFTIYKFRSMVKNAEAKTGAVWASKNDARVTKFGLFMRKTRLDELPQLLNVIKGEMSFVGPRPERKVFIDQFLLKIPYYYKRLSVKPGLTGWAQVKHKYDESFDDVIDKTKFDLFYIENMSLKLDLIILFNTIGVVLNRKGQ